MEDLLHPDDEGHLSIAKCLLPRIQDVLGGGDDGSALQEEPCSRDSSADSSADSSSKPDVACE